MLVQSNSAIKQKGLRLVGAAPIEAAAPGDVLSASGDTDNSPGPGGAPAEAQALRVLLAGEIRKRVERVEAIALGQPVVVTQLLTRLENFMATGAVSAQVLRENDTREFLLDALSSMRESLAVHAAGRLSDLELASLLEHRGLTLSRHSALRKGKLVTSSRVTQYVELLKEDSQVQSRDPQMAIPAAVKKILLDAANNARAEQAPLEARMVEANLGLVNLALKLFRLYGDERAQLESEGRYRLLLCVREFRPEQGNTFATYAVAALRNSMAAALKEIRSGGRIGAPQGEPGEAARVFSLHKPVAGPDSIDLMGLVADRRFRDPQELTSDVDDRALAKSILCLAMNQLEPAHRKAIASRYGIESGIPQTLASVAQELGVTISQARTLVDSGKKRIMQAIAESGAASKVIDALNLTRIKQDGALSEGQSGLESIDSSREPSMHEEMPKQVFAKRKGSTIKMPVVGDASADVTGDSALLAPDAKDRGKIPDKIAPVVPPPASALNLSESLKNLIAASDELGTNPKLTAGEGLWKVTEEYYQSLRQARIIGRSPDGGAAVLAAHVRKCKELIESVQRRVCGSWPLGHVEGTHGFRLEGEMLQMKKDPTTAHLVLALDATVQYLKRLPR